METCTEHESIPPAHLLPGMCPTSRWHSAKPSETTPFAQVAPSALLRCCGNTVRLLNSGIQPGSPPPSVTERTRQLEPVIWPRQNYACKGLATPYWCDTLATTMKWHEISLYMHKPTSSPSRFHFHARKKGSCEHPTEESKDSHDERCFETTMFPHHCGTTAAKVPSSYAHSIARCRTALAPHCSRPGSLACIGNKKGYGSVSRMCGEGK